MALATRMAAEAAGLEVLGSLVLQAEPAQGTCTALGLDGYVLELVALRRRRDHLICRRRVGPRV
jgi:hypothetical protein